MPTYQSELREGERYERFVFAELGQIMGRTFTRCETRADQIQHGDSFEGYEVKFDKRLADTGNICIEVESKTDPAQPAYRADGIMSGSDFRIYCIGNYAECYLIRRTVLVRMWEQLMQAATRRDGINWKHVAGGDIRLYETPTSRGFLIANVTARTIGKRVEFET